MNKRGTMLDILYAAAMAVPIIIISLLIVFMFNQAYDAAMPTMNASSPTAGNILTTASSALDVVLAIVPIIPIFMGIAAVVLAYFIPSHPIFLPSSILISVLTVFFSFYFSNILYEFFTVGGALTTFINNYAAIVLIGQNLPTFAVVFSVIQLIVMYTRRDYITGGVAY